MKTFMGFIAEEDLFARNPRVEKRLANTTRNVKREIEKILGQSIGRTPDAHVNAFLMGNEEKIKKLLAQGHNLQDILDDAERPGFSFERYQQKPTSAPSSKPPAPKRSIRNIIGKIPQERPIPPQQPGWQPEKIAYKQEGQGPMRRTATIARGKGVGAPSSRVVPRHTVPTQTAPTAPAPTTRGGAVVRGLGKGARVLGPAGTAVGAGVAGYRGAEEGDLYGADPQKYAQDLKGGLEPVRGMFDPLSTSGVGERIGVAAGNIGRHLQGIGKDFVSNLKYGTVPAAGLAGLDYMETPYAALRGRPGEGKRADAADRAALVAQRTGAGTEEIRAKGGWLSQAAHPDVEVPTRRTPSREEVEAAARLDQIRAGYAAPGTRLRKK